MQSNSSLTALAATIVSSYVTRNHISAPDLPALIQVVYGGLTSTLKPTTPARPMPGPLTAAQIRKSVTPEWIVSFEDGRPRKTMKRHLALRGLTPAQYRTKWGLKDSYPMVSANCSARRSAVARASGLGREGRRQKATAAPLEPRALKKSSKLATKTANAPNARAGRQA